LDINQIHRQEKQNIQKRELIKFKKFHTAKETAHRMKGKSAEWEKIFVNHTSDKVLISKIGVMEAEGT
jgi:hypothetical protein